MYRMEAYHQQTALKQVIPFIQQNMTKINVNNKQPFANSQHFLKNRKQILLSFFRNVFLLSIILISSISYAQVSAEQLQQELNQAEANNSIPNQSDILDALKSGLNWLNEADSSRINSKKHQSIIDNYNRYVKEINQKIAEVSEQKPQKVTAKNASEFEQAIVRTNSQLLEIDRQLQQEQEALRDISSLPTPQQIADNRIRINEIQRRLNDMSPDSSALMRAQNMLLQAEQNALNAKIEELELAQLSTNNRQELTRLRIDLYRARYAQTDDELQNLRDSLNTLRQEEAEKALAQTKELTENNEFLPESLRSIIHANRELSNALNRETDRIQSIIQQQRDTAHSTQQVREVLDNFTEQAQWLGSSPVLGESLRAEVSRLPEMPQTQTLNREMADLKVDRIKYQRQLKDLPLVDELMDDEGEPLNEESRKIAETQLTTKRDLLTSLIASHDTQTVELTRLIVANSQLINALNQVRESSHRYLFWVADLSPINLTLPIELIRELYRFISLGSFNELTSALTLSLQNNENKVYIGIAILFVAISIMMRRRYIKFLQNSSNKIGKVTQDSFLLTLHAIFWALFVSLPLPILWATIGYTLQSAWEYPLAVALGMGMTNTVPILWIFMLSKVFAHPQGLFIAHFRWQAATVSRAMRYYLLSIWLIVPLIILTSTFDIYNDREFASSLGRLSFMLLCFALTLVTASFKRAGVMLLKSNRSANDSLVNRFFWSLLLIAPMIAALAAAIGYLSTAIALLIRLETSVLIIFSLRFIYYVVHRGMLIQRRKLDFERAKQKRAEILAERAKQGQITENKENVSSFSENSVEIEMIPIDLDTISAQSLRLVGSLLTLTGFILVALLWSELHSAFGFLNNVRLWETSQIVQGVETVQAITLASLFVAGIVFIITAQLVRNLPALLELAILQHLELQPGTGFTITTLSKYVIMLIGGIIGFSWVGIEWSKLQWLIAALGVGLGFGLQEIFANFISGIILLFEKPVRIGDVVTLRNLTGTIARIRTRATEIVDFDNKEIIVPNKAFITEQFINWSLSDPITRIVMTIPVEQDADTKLVEMLLIKAANDCDMVVDTPVPPEAYLINMENGIQQFNLRVHTNSVRYLMPLRHEVHQNILKNFRDAGLRMPYPPIQVRTEMVHKN